MKKYLFILLIGLLFTNGNVCKADTTFTRKVVVEEGTGTWCAWCVRGIVGMADMKTKYPNTFIGIAVHNGDDMALSSYSSSLGLSGYPQCNINRKHKQANPEFSSLESFYKTLVATEAPAKVELSATYNIEKDQIEVETTTTFGYTSSNVNCRLTYAVVENKVTSANKQSNAYSGGYYGKMGGWENLGSSVETLFDDVARSISPSYTGLSNSIPASVTENTPLTHNYSFAMPSMIQNVSQVEVIVMLLDVATGEIINADKTHLLVEGTIPAKGITFEDKNKTFSLSFNKGETMQLKATTLPLFSTEVINWTSSNPGVAKVSAAGLVTALSEGEAIIQATTSSGSFSASCTINSILYVDVESVSLDATELELELNKQYKFKTTVLPENASNKKLTATSSNEDIVGFITSGSIIIRAKKTGKATITVRSQDKSSVYTTCKVTVVEPGSAIGDINNEDVMTHVFVKDNTIYFTLNQAGKGVVELYDTTGKQLYNANFNSLEGEELNIPFYGQKGIYILKINTDKGNFVKKVIL
ncbi:Ig-like domain-containing protein [Bacteroidales bacterium OttesenSCG-928-M11]|nr:Ig-like domain-containing protein [Bacteroidales bacterium OttesenSCG-928-M11]